MAAVFQPAADPVIDAVKRADISAQVLEHHAQRGVCQGATWAKGATEKATQARGAFDVLMRAHAKPITDATFVTATVTGCGGAPAAEASTDKDFSALFGESPEDNVSVEATGNNLAATELGINQAPKGAPLLKKMEVAGCTEECAFPCFECDWELCIIIADHGALLDVKIVSDNEVCNGVSAKFVRPRVTTPPRSPVAKAATTAADPVTTEGEAPGIEQGHSAPRPTRIWSQRVTGGGTHAHASSRSY